MAVRQLQAPLEAKPSMSARVGSRYKRNWSGPYSGVVKFQHCDGRCGILG
jgi:hypothetical protein